MSYTFGACKIGLLVVYWSTYTSILVQICTFTSIQNEISPGNWISYKSKPLAKHYILQQLCIEFSNQKRWLLFTTLREPHRKYNWIRMKFDEISKFSIEVKSNQNVCVQSNVSLLVLWCLRTLRQEREIAQRTTTTITTKKS